VRCRYLTDTDPTALEESSSTLIVKLNFSVSRYDWKEIRDVQNMSIFGIRLYPGEIDPIIKHVKLLSNRISASNLDDHSKNQNLSLDGLKRKVKGMGHSLLRSSVRSNLLYPDLRSLALHMCDPAPKAILPAPIVQALKVFIEDRQQEDSRPFELRLCPSPGNEALQWFHDNGVSCILTSRYDNERYVKASASNSATILTQSQVDLE
jgi:hypothetical protein